jgi:hypothetical protein
MTEQWASDLEAKHGVPQDQIPGKVEPGTAQDEQTLKLAGTCPKCGESLAASLAK